MKKGAGLRTDLPCCFCSFFFLSKSVLWVQPWLLPDKNIKGTPLKSGFLLNFAQFIFDRLGDCCFGKGISRFSELYLEQQRRLETPFLIFNF
jgi:hypothetical protein